MSDATAAFRRWLEDPRVGMIVAGQHREIFAVDACGATLETVQLESDEPPIDPFEIKREYAGRIDFRPVKNWRGDALLLNRLRRK